MITAIIGDNFYVRKQHLTTIKSDFASKYADYDLEQFDASEVEYQKIVDSLQNVSLFSSNKLVIVTDFMSNKDLTDKIATFIASVPSGVTLVLAADKVDKRTATFAILKASVKIIECKSPISMHSWIVDEVKRKNGSIRQADAQLLLDRLGPNQTLLAQEIDKLLLYSPAISKESIELLTVSIPQSSVFQLLDAAFSGRKTTVVRLYREQREMKVEPLAIIGMITWQLYVLAIVKAAEQKGISDVARQAKLNPYVVSKSQQLVKGRTLSNIRDMLKKLLNLEIRLKSQAVDADDALQLFLLTELC